MFYLNTYSRIPEEDKYRSGLAYSVHFGYSYDGIHYAPLNQNYGILFAKAEIREDNTICAKGVQNPRLYHKDDKYAILAEYVDISGGDISEGISPKKNSVENSAVAYSNDENCHQSYYLWTTKDFLEFQEIGAVDRDMMKTWDEISNQVALLPDSVGKEIVDAWVPLRAQEVMLPKDVQIHAEADLEDVKAVVRYTDGSTDEKLVEWNTESIAKKENGDFCSGKYTVTGVIKKPNFRYPLAIGYADPVLFKWEGYWYFLSTNDNLGNIGMFLRRAETEEALFDERALERCILPYNEVNGFIQTFWAPEFHVIGDELYILFAVSGTKWGPQCHMMKWKKGTDLLEPSSWEKPIRVLKKDGSPLTEEGISLDMTYFEAGGKHYVAWSYRFAIGTKLDTGSMIYIATIDAHEPWVLTSDPIQLSRPLYGWENIDGTINNEGPYALKHEGKVYLAFSGGSANGYSYAVGYLIADEQQDLTDITNWKKYPCPVLSYYSVGIEGPGHNSFYVSEDGKTMVAYHGQLHTRCSAIHRVHFNKKGFPLLNLSPERDIPEENRVVAMDIVVG